MMVMSEECAGIEGPFQSTPLPPAGEGRTQVVRLGRVRVRAERPSRSEEHTSELQSLMRTSYAVFGLTKNRRVCPSGLHCVQPTATGQAQQAKEDLITRNKT